MPDPVIRPHRFQASPFMPAYMPPGTSVGIYNDRMYPWAMGDDIQQKYWHLRHAVMLYDVPETPVEIAGAQACELLNYLFTRDISTLRVGRACYAIACDSDGGILMDGVLMRLDESRYWYVMANGPFESWLRAHAMHFDVRVRDPNSWVLQIQGPRALEVLARVVDGELRAPFNYFAVAECTIDHQPVIVSRTGWTAEMGFEIYASDGVDGPRLWRHLLAGGEQYELQYGGLDSMGIRRIEAGIFDNGTDIDPSLTPYAAGLGNFVNLGKREFIGRKALVNADRTLRLHGITCPSTAPARGDRVVCANNDVGTVTSAAWSLELDYGVGFAKLGVDPQLTGPLTIVKPDGVEHPIAFAELPFFDKEKLLPRGPA